MPINNSVPTKTRARASSSSSPKQSPARQSPIKRYEPVRRSTDSGSNALLILVAILAVILVVVLILIFKAPPRPNDNQSGITSSTDTSIPMDSGSNTPAQQDPTSDWLIYDKASTTYLFKYSKEWALKEQGQGIALTLPVATNSEITFYVQSSTKPLVEYLAELDKVSATAYEGKPSLQVQSSTPFTSGDIKGVQRRQLILAAGLEQEVIYLNYNNKIFTIALNSPKITTDLENTFGLFLSTFKLIPVAPTSTPAVNSSSTLPTSTPSEQPKTITYSNAKYKFEVNYASALTSQPSQQNADGITINNGKYKLIITGMKGAVPSLIKYQPNGAKIAGQVTIAGKEAVKLFTAKPTTNSDTSYTQYVLPINDTSWIKIEYFGRDDVAKSFEDVIATLKFTK